MVLIWIVPLVVQFDINSGASGGISAVGLLLVVNFENKL